MRSGTAVWSSRRDESPVNLAPADLRKTGASLNAAIAVAILLGSEQARANGARALIGELSLGDELRRVPGILSMVAALARRGVARVVVCRVGGPSLRSGDPAADQSGSGRPGGTRPSDHASGWTAERSAFRRGSAMIRHGMDGVLIEMTMMLGPDERAGTGH